MKAVHPERGISCRDPSQRPNCFERPGNQVPNRRTDDLSPTNGSAAPVRRLVLRRRVMRIYHREQHHRTRACRLHHGGTCRSTRGTHQPQLELPTPVSGRFAANRRVVNTRPPTTVSATTSGAPSRYPPECCANIRLKLFTRRNKRCQGSFCIDVFDRCKSRCLDRTPAQLATLHKVDVRRPRRYHGYWKPGSG